MIQLNDKMKEFIGCRYAWREYGFDDLCLFTQACLESGNFLSVIGQNNCFGRKVPMKRVWTGKILERPTKEHEAAVGLETREQALQRLRAKWRGNGKHNVEIIGHAPESGFWIIHIFDWFIDLPTMEQMVLNQCEFIKGNFGDAFMNRKDPVQFFTKLTDKIPDFKGDSDLQYATDHAYTRHLVSRMNEIKASTVILGMLTAP
jgi:hypothetical protein